jgi:hypothetical protein
LFQEYEFEVIVKQGKFNSGPNHLLHILSGEDARNLVDNILDTHILVVKMFNDYFEDMVQLLSIWIGLPEIIVA